MIFSDPEFITLSPQANVKPFDRGVAVLSPSLSEIDFAYANAASLPQNARQTLFSLPWSEFVARPDARARFGVMAKVLGTSLIAVDTPGIGSGELDRDDRKEIKNGDFKPLALRQWHSLGNRVSGNVDLLGYSEGALGATALAATAPEYVNVESMTLLEGVGYRKTNLARFMASFGIDGMKWNAYKQANPKWFRELVEDAPNKIADEPANHWAYVHGMTRGTAFNNIAEAREHETISKDTEIIVAHGGDSRTSSFEANAHLVERLRTELSQAAVRHVVFNGESHGMIDSLPSIAAALKALQ